MSELILYPKVVVPKKDFSKAKKWTLPNQCMTMQEILLRFTKNEPLPIEKQDAYYATNLGDLEKLARKDFTYQDEIWDHIAKSAAMFNSQEAEKKKKAEADKLERDRLGAPVLTVPQTQAKSAGGGGAGEGPPAAG